MGSPCVPGAEISVGVPSFPRATNPRRWLICLLLLLSLGYIRMSWDSYMEDFHAYYLAAIETRQHLDPYVNQVNVNERYADALWLRADSRFIYPPSALFAFYPLEVLPYRYAKFAFGCLIILTMVMVFTFLHERFPGTWPVLLVLFLSIPATGNVNQGQIDFLILALLLSAYYLKDGWLAGTCLGIAISIKLAPILVVGWFAVNRRWRTAAWSLAWTGATTLLAIQIWGTQLYREFFQHLQTHADWSAPRMSHVFRTVQVLHDRLITVGGRTYSFLYIGGGLQNPLRHLGKFTELAGVGIVVLYLAYLAFTKHGRSLRPETSFFGFLVASLFANALLWPMGLVACFPLLILLVHQSKSPLKTTVLLVTPFLLPFHAAEDRSFLLWLVALLACLVLHVRPFKLLEMRSRSNAPLPGEWKRVS